ncbi:MAG: anaerobic glycerol-3-phosphate dehydrogenase subunit C [Sedimentisphaerales bacterium]|nr:anaerobic glycerol-3-phosphate dehydrogenase subunit C [Sedimentisphaerales bacterium]
MAKTLDQMQRDLSGLVSGGAQDVLTDVFSRVGFSTDASMYQLTPMCVVRPRTAQDAAAVVRYAAENGISVAGRGAGSGLAGESLTTGIVLDMMRHMNRIIGANEDGSRVTVQPGVVLDDLNASLARYGKKIGPDPSSGNRAVMGGIVANNATGAHSLQYGYIANWVESLEVVLADGNIVRLENNMDPAGTDDEKGGTVQRLARHVQQTLEDKHDMILAAQPNTKRNRCGYNIVDVVHDGRVDLARLMAGSEGTLGVFTEITLRTVDVPVYKALVQLEFESFEKMARAVPIIVDSGAATCELMDRRLMDLAVQALPQYQDLFPKRCTAVLLIEHVGDKEEQVREKIQQTIQEVGPLSYGAVPIYDEEAQQRNWKSRKDAVPLLSREKGPKHAVAFMEDVSVENHRLAEYVVRLEELGKRYDIPLAFYGHAGDGELHIRPYLDLSDPEDVTRMRQMALEVFEIAWSLGGTISGEHADGLARTAFIRRQYGDAYYEVLRQIKTVFDPKGVMNPGKIISDDPDVMVKNLRAEHALLPDRLKTHLLFSPEEFRFEIDQCNGCGVCLSCRSGSRMCPTFRALQEELASSRGKANLLRAWITGQISEEDLESTRFWEVIGHCVNCKMCSVECPSGVDVSKLVIEARAQRAARKGNTRTEMILAHIRYMSMLSSLFSPISNAFLSLSPFKWVIEKMLGLDRFRSMPKFLRGSFIKKGRRYLTQQPPINSKPVDRVLYFVDSYANWNDHELGFAVLKVLGHNGIDVVLPDQRPAPLPAMVYGDLKTARADLAYSIKHLAPFVRQGYTIVCSEPSAALCLKEELRLLIDSEDARLVSSHTVELMDYLEGLRQEDRLKPVANRQESESVYAYHAPCHVCALRIRGRSLTLLKELAGTAIVDIHSGCCGLAGTCGMQKKNRDMSAAIGKDMADKLKAMDTPFALTECATCRMQIEHLTDKTVFHPIKLLARAYGL